MKSKHKQQERRSPGPGGSAARRTHWLWYGVAWIAGTGVLLTMIGFGFRTWRGSDPPAMRQPEPHADRRGLAAAPPSARADARGGGSQEAVVSKVNRANELLAQDKPAEAVSVLTEAMELNPNDEDVHYNLGLAYTRLGKLDEAIQQYKDALRIFPSYVEAHNNLGNVLMRAGRTDEAIAQFESAVKIKPDYASAHNNLGTALQRLGRSNEALLQFQGAAKLMPDYWEAHFNLGTSLLQAGELAKAREQFDTVLRLHPDFEPAKAALAEAQRKGGGP